MDTGQWMVVFLAITKFTAVEGQKLEDFADILNRNFGFQRDLFNCCYYDMRSTKVMSSTNVMMLIRLRVKCI